MASVRALVMVKWLGEERTPGTTLHGFDLVEARRHPRFYQIVDGDEDAPVPEIDVEAPGEPVDGLSAADGVDTPPGDFPAQAPGGEPSRVAEIADAFDLLDESDYSGTGRPKVAPLKAILGFKPTADEIDAAILLREEV